MHYLLLKYHRMVYWC